MIMRPSTKARLVAAAHERISILGMGFIVGPCLVVGGIMLSVFNHVPTSIMYYRLIMCGLAVLAICAIVRALYALFIEGIIAREDDDDFLLTHARYSSAGFIASSFAICIAIATGDCFVSYWGFMSMLVLEGVTCWFLLQGLGFAQESITQFHVPQFVI